MPTGAGTGSPALLDLQQDEEGFIKMSDLMRALQKRDSKDGAEHESESEEEVFTSLADLAKDEEKETVPGQQSITVQPILPARADLISWMSEQKVEETQPQDPKAELPQKNKETNRRAGLPSWLGEDSESDCPEEMDEESKAKQEQTKEVSQLPSWLVDDGCDEAESGFETGTGETGQGVETEEELLAREVSGPGVEVWQVESAVLLCPRTLAILLCSLLNRKEGGLLLAGPMRADRKERDRLRQQVDRVCRDLLRPSATPDQVDLQLVAAGAGTGRHWLRCPVRGVAGLEYRATGLAGLRDGVYTRGQSGPDFCVYVGP